jgi:hypothetical protein
LSLGENELFCLRDSSMIFPILSALSMQYLGRFLPDEDGSKLSRLYRVFLALAKDYGDPIHIIRAYTIYCAARGNEIHRFHIFIYLTRHSLGFDNKFFESIEIAEKIMGIYDFNLHSEKLISTYGSDRVLHTAAFDVQYRYLIGRYSCN